ncbi:uncharacterized protein LOC124910438 [Impatiens glandulifera]|uniref:uncharacterized protein LOC124910438 n=1 Tax=Impatiens glandulifera TaxID=253017 RepID=UPI001FB104A3|nr:uncharacterized protein LOC124910438 [Impatiens glandulifera]
MISLSPPPTSPFQPTKQNPTIPYWKITNNEPIIVLRRPSRTNPLIWCCAIICLIFSILLIIIAITTLIIVFALKPKTPNFDTPNAILNLVYFDSPDNFNGDFIFLANFTNPNKKVDVRFEYVNLELYFSDNLISAQGLQPFSMRKGETRLVTLRMISSMVFLPQNSAVKLQRQVLANRVNFKIRGTFKVKVNLGPVHFSYWLHGWCQLEMTSPPSGVLVARNCRTKR